MPAHKTPRDCLEKALAMYKATGFPGAGRVRRELAELPPPVESRLRRVVRRLLGQ